MVMKIRCTRCGSAKFIFTVNGQADKRHGACCACCQKPLSATDLLPNTTVDPIARCLIKKSSSTQGR